MKKFLKRASFMSGLCLSVATVITVVGIVIRLFTGHMTNDGGGWIISLVFLVTLYLGVGIGITGGAYAKDMEQFDE